MALPGGEEARWLSWLNIFGGLLFPRREVARIIGSEKMQESSAYRGIPGDGERMALLRVLQSRFGSPLPDDLVEELNRLEEPKQLEPLIDLAATCSSLEQFRAALRPRRRRR
jgi:hypothetical protein